MQFWQRFKTKIRLVWNKNQKVIIFMLLGIALLTGMGIGIYRHWPPIEEEAAVIQPVSREEMELVVQAQVENVLLKQYPWILEEPVQQTAVEPPSPPMPVPTETKPEIVSFDELIWPVRGEVVTPFGWYRHPVYGDWRFNAGIEFSAVGEVVRTVLAGEIVSVTSNDLETELIIDHGSGWTSVYRSIKGLTVVPGERVVQNQEIAVTDNGVVFFGLNHNRAPVNPQAFLR